MKYLYKIILALISGILIFISCCTEKDCDRDIFPQITVSLHHPANEETVFEKIYILEKENQKIIDTLILNKTPVITLNKWVMHEVFGDKREFGQYDYILHSTGSIDTLDAITYERTAEQIDCNTCFPFGDGSATVTDFKSLAFEINDQLYTAKDTVTLIVRN